MKKRSVSILGHATSITLEDEFWGALKKIAQRNGQSMNALVAEIDQNRGAHNLSSALRIHVLKTYQNE
ncbi:MAG: ribbon-helix-helix domain-containing protein [Alphaproteobacteria bacterium]|nr:ribbon-helix-helix domain-containing protein [Alphaproteobacteria bacterium]